MTQNSEEGTSESVRSGKKCEETQKRRQWKVEKILQGRQIE